MLAIFNEITKFQHATIFYVHCGNGTVLTARENNIYDEIRGYHVTISFFMATEITLMFYAILCDNQRLEFLSVIRK